VGVALALVKGPLAIPLVRVLTRALAVAVATDEARFARSLVETGLIDEYRLVVHPVVLGAGERLFTAPLTIEPMSTTIFSGGGVAHVFAARP
jgi:hypothetical protein